MLSVRYSGAHLRACRLAAGMSQKELAARSGVAAGTISNLERGTTRRPYSQSLHRLAGALRLAEQLSAAPADAEPNPAA
jgi:transcriptional regulator with XRE-family HTH domain